MWCGSFSSTGPTVAVLTTLPYVGEVLSASRTARKYGAGGSSTASSFKVLNGVTASCVCWISEPVVSPALSSPAHTSRYSCGAFGVPALVSSCLDELVTMWLVTQYCLPSLPLTTDLTTCTAALARVCRPATTISPIARSNAAPTGSRRLRDSAERRMARSLIHLPLTRLLAFGREP